MKKKFREYTSEELNPECICGHSENNHELFTGLPLIGRLPFISGCILCTCNRFKKVNQ